MLFPFRPKSASSSMLTSSRPGVQVTMISRIKIFLEMILLRTFGKGQNLRFIAGVFCSFVEAGLCLDARYQQYI
jgi:hypothetical protein